jgi:hypothetical protein
MGCFATSVRDSELAWVRISIASRSAGTSPPPLAMLTTISVVAGRQPGVMSPISTTATARATLMG